MQGFSAGVRYGKIAIASPRSSADRASASGAESGSSSLPGGIFVVIARRGAAAPRHSRGISNDIFQKIAGVSRPRFNVQAASRRLFCKPRACRYTIPAGSLPSAE